MDAVENFGAVLSTTPPIVESILKNLKIKDLYNCAKVCKLWSDIVRTIKKRNKHIFWSFSDCNCGEGYDTSQNSLPYSLTLDLPMASIDPKFALLFCSQQYFGKLQKLARKIEKEDSKNCYSNGEDSNAKGKKRGSYKKKATHKEVMNYYLSRCVPRSCAAVFCSAVGVIGCRFNGCVPVEVESGEGLAALFLPSMDGVSVYHFPITSKLCFNCLSAVTGIPEEQKIKCLLAFTRTQPFKKGTFCKAIDQFLLREENNLVLGGAVVNDIFSPTDSLKDIGSFGIAFVGDNVTATSVILKEDVRTVDCVRKKLMQLKNCSVLGYQNCGFMLACVARGIGLYNKGNIEADVFHELFPTVPLLGVFGNGEIGTEYLPNCSTPREENYLHTYSTVFVLLSFKR